MSAEDLLNDTFSVLEEETMKANEQVQAYQRKLMDPIWHKRRELVKKIPNFWGTAIGNSPIFAINPSENDLEALDNLTDFHVEYDHDKPDYRKIVATFKKNGVFKNETLTKEITVDPESDGTTVSKTTIEYHENKGPSKKRKASDDNEDEDDDFNVSFIDWFGDDDVRAGIILSEDIFPNAVEYYQGSNESDDDDENAEIDLDDSEGEDEEEDEKPRSKKPRK
ncbi:hypothetical protein [Parasitella parasitica]|uniref:Uncharacterized protein n=1 Tax=Parasitella parasitica TaxID=35722 RepID=A0A0B7N9K8_9FUNG|nr:hypothetical protein [Parasitella parasitica]